MPSTFNGLEVARRALNTQQSALYTTGHNIANANTEGFTRQRVNMTQTAPYPPASRNRPEIPGQVGSGVEAGSIERVRDSFLDIQYRQENSKVGFYETKANAMSQMETILNEPSEEGLSHSMDQFWQSLQDLAVNPEDSGARSVVRQRGIAVSEAFQYINSSLEGVRNNLNNEITVDQKQVNSYMDQINSLNQQISEIEPHGYLPNDLYDERDRLIDGLSELVNIKVTYDKSNGQPSSIAQGIATVTLAGNGAANGVTLVDGATKEVNHMTFNFGDDNNVENISFSDDPTVVEAHDFGITGKLKALMEGNGYLDQNGDAAGEFNVMLSNLDEMAEAFVAEFNTVHQQGTNLTDDQSYDFFEFDGAGRAASTIDVTDDIKQDKDKIAASLNGDSGDGENADLLSDVYTKLDIGLGEKTSVKSFYESAIGEMAVIAQEANRMVNNAGVLRQQVQENRQSVSAVSLDEEMTNLIKFQHAYNAAARNMTTVDEMLDRIINNMGLVGR
ncbi:flagellar hook-associated protein FlgK [Saliterribacillus persicus]|uniref:Flagellar hook-associated protein 1 n=1 Tax=Saliterribacillus persicus TaxID=930114 RepID=A0A368Y5W9_9BACI|nr:flagellar hook-associated protein FlgK [Saliterribacillus persicus]RCW74728.1 flagellar hook-associated protein 1 FlgK [Saliterribacillus persicus]